MKYDALLVLSFGGPDKPEDVIPFLQNVAGGRIPPERLAEVAEHYHHFGGASPINGQNRALIAALAAEMAAYGLDLPVYWGNRNWHPLITDTMRQMCDDGIKRALVFVTSAYSSYSGCRQYLEDIARAREAVGADAPMFDKLRVFYNHPGFIGPMIEYTCAALEQFPAEERESVKVIFTAHSISLTMARRSDYVAQLQEAAYLVAQGIGRDDYQLVYQSRSGSPHTPWLEPDICNTLEQIKAEGVTNVAIVPIGFISDHMEVLFDLDTEAKDLADSLGLKLVRAATVGTHPAFIRMICELMLERMAENPVRHFLGDRGPSHDVCPADCCLRG